MKKLTAVFFFAYFCCHLFAQSNIPSYVPTNGLVGYWPFNGNANDESGNGNNGTVNGATLTSDRFGNIGKAYKFEGQSNITVPDNDLLDLVNDFSISANLIAYSFPSNQFGGKINMIVAKRPNIVYDITGTYSFGVWDIDNNGYHRVSFQAPPNANQQTYSENSGRILLNNWYNVTVTYKKSTNNIKYFLNGVEIFNKSLQYEIENTEYPLTIGNSCLSYFWNGSLDDIAIYNRTLTQQEITQLYQAQSTTNTSDTTTTKPVPPGIPYQAVIRNASGQIMTNANVTAQFTLHKDSAIGGVEYQEVHSLTTNAQGLINTILGKGTATQGTFAGINWAKTNKFLQVQMDLGNGYVDLGTQQLMSVPYAMYAANGPKGEKGDVGPQGPQGIQGAKGDAGQQGPAGNGFQNGTANGQMMYWKDSAWVTVSPGQYGQYLAYCDGVPSWGGCLPKITTNSIDNLTSTSATIGGYISSDGGSPIIARGVCWSTNPNPTIELDNKTTNGSGKGTFTSNINGLLHLSTYYVRAYATNSLGTSYGDQQIITGINRPCVSIGSQLWTSQNLDVTTYRNGDPIPQVTDPIQWTNLITGAWSWYNNDSANYWQYGKLYNWYAVNDSRGIAPNRWHVPTIAEWKKMTKYLDSTSDTTNISGTLSTIIGPQLKSTSGWNIGNGTNSSDFAALPGGMYGNNGSFYLIGNYGFWWTSSSENGSSSYAFYYILHPNSRADLSLYTKTGGFSVRLVSD